VAGQEEAGQGGEARRTADDLGVERVLELRVVELGDRRLLVEKRRFRLQQGKWYGER
jgi:hypothetical protein